MMSITSLCRLLVRKCISFMSRYSRKSRQKITEAFRENCKKSWQNPRHSIKARAQRPLYYILYYIYYILYSPQNSTFSTATIITCSARFFLYYI